VADAGPEVFCERRRELAAASLFRLTIGTPPDPPATDPTVIHASETRRVAVGPTGIDTLPYADQLPMLTSSIACA
jgi:hypothetical protein